MGMAFIDDVKEKARGSLKTIVLPESEDRRTLDAADRILREGFAKLILVETGWEGDTDKTSHSDHPDGCEVVSH